MVKKFGISLGDPSGISPEIFIKSIPSLKNGIFILYGSKSILEKTSKKLGLNFNINIINLPEEAEKEGVYLININDNDFEIGKPSKETGQASVDYLKRTVEDVLNKKLDGIITLPISKKYIMEAGFKYAGHTDYLADVSGVKEYLMVLMCEKMKVALITTHIPLKDVPLSITKEKIINKGILLWKELKEKFKIKNPKIAVLGLNPHAGDGGNIGKEEIEIIKPAVYVLREKGINVTEPISADTGFNRFKEFDAYLAMYHDQGLIPLKLLCFKKAVNITLGLPFVRTSPDHGTGYDIAGKGIADPSSFLEAVKLAQKLV